MSKYITQEKKLRNDGSNLDERFLETIEYVDKVLPCLDILYCEINKSGPLEVQGVHELPCNTLTIDQFKELSPWIQYTDIYIKMLNISKKQYNELKSLNTLSERIYITGTIDPYS